jgi:hypothetical protein
MLEEEKENRKRRKWWRSCDNRGKQINKKIKIYILK